MEEEGAADEHERVAGEDAVPEAAHELGDDQRHERRLLAGRRQPLIHVCRPRTAHASALRAKSPT